MNADQGRPDPVARLFGALLMAVGTLMMALCGLCSLVFVISTAGGGGGEMGGMLLLVLVIGGVPIAIGFGLFWLGRRLWRPKPR